MHSHQEDRSPQSIRAHILQSPILCRRAPVATFLHALRPFHAGLAEHPQRCAEGGLASQSSDKRADLEACHVSIDCNRAPVAVPSRQCRAVPHNRHYGMTKKEGDISLRKPSAKGGAKMSASGLSKSQLSYSTLESVKAALSMYAEVNK